MDYRTIHEKLQEANASVRDMSEIKFMANLKSLCGVLMI